MASSLSQKVEKEVLAHIFGKATATKHTEYWLALCYQAPTSASTGSTIKEVGYGGYARLKVLPAEMKEAEEGTPGKITNSATLTFAGCTSEGTNKEAKWVAICTASTAGTVIAWGELETAITVTEVNTPVVFGAEKLVITAS